MTRHARYDPSGPSPHWVIAWYDDDQTPQGTTVEVSDEIWNRRMVGGWHVEDGELIQVVAEPQPPPINVVLPDPNSIEERLNRLEARIDRMESTIHE
jgi:hypothetical protein